MIQRRIFSARSSLLRTRRIPDTPSSARLLLTENLSPLEPRYRGNIESPPCYSFSIRRKGTFDPVSFSPSEKETVSSRQRKRGRGETFRMVSPHPFYRPEPCSELAAHGIRRIYDRICRQKKPAPFRFRRGGENSISAVSFFLSERQPFHWVDCRFLYPCRSG